MSKETLIDDITMLSHDEALALCLTFMEVVIEEDVPSSTASALNTAFTAGVGTCWQLLRGVPDPKYTFFSELVQSTDAAKYPEGINIHGRVGYSWPISIFGSLKTAIGTLVMSDEDHEDYFPPTVPDPKLMVDYLVDEKSVPVTDLEAVKTTLSTPPLSLSNNPPPGSTSCTRSDAQWALRTEGLIP